MPTSGPGKSGLIIQGSQEGLNFLCKISIPGQTGLKKQGLLYPESSIYIAFQYQYNEDIIL